MNKITKKAQQNAKKADQYNDPNHNYLHYWDGREYEHAAEEIAIRRLLKNMHISAAADIGGGYGRLSKMLTEYAEKVVLLEPSQKQLDIAKIYLKDTPRVERKLGQANPIDLKDESMDLVTMIRVMHHLPDPSEEFKEIHRVLRKNGKLILEVANYAHGRNRVMHLLRGKKLPLKPVDIRSEKMRGEDVIAFVNHNPSTVVKQLAHAGFKVEKVLSVSNLRNQNIKKILPKNLMLQLEKIMQPTLAKTYFGPSVFFLVKKAK